jgi:hypothetical protein
MKRRKRWRRPWAPVTLPSIRNGAVSAFLTMTNRFEQSLELRYLHIMSTITCHKPARSACVRTPSNLAIQGSSDWFNTGIAVTGARSISDFWTFFAEVLGDLVSCVVSNASCLYRCRQGFIMWRFVSTTRLLLSMVTVTKSRTTEST